ncbi:TolC family protein [Thermocrinis minervae]|uniref:Outer membrane protein TolC n=1 Tax=Thermocrinis minervae TaxID=381751 RepID=A0A1M6QPS2_9AQUI|nr:TolC family protein [Thermocrinis minervae]SHK22234.1 Outer membrane protein TolC [Thermocrinis minervae]
MLLLFILLFSLCFPQEVIRLDPVKAYELAFKNNLQLKALRYSLESISYELEESKNYFLPKILVGTGLIWDSKKDEWDKTFGLSLYSVFYEVGKTSALIESNELRLKARQEALKELENQIKLRILELFASILYLERMAQAKREEMAVAFVRFDRERVKKELGLSTDLKVLSLEEVYRKRSAELAKIQEEYNRKLLELKKLCGIDMHATVEIAHMEPKNLPDTLDAKAFLSRLDNNPMLRIKDYEIRELESRLRAIDNLFKPIVNLRGELGTTIRSGFPATKSYPQNGARIGIELFIPIFDASVLYKKMSISSRMKELQTQREDLRKALELKILSSEYEYESLIKELIHAQVKDKLKEEELNYSRSTYELELAFDLGYAMSEKSQAQAQLLKTKLDILLFLARLRNLVGLDPFGVLEESHALD